MRTLNATLLKVTGLAIIAMALTIFLACGGSSDTGDGVTSTDNGDAAEHIDDDHEGDTDDEIVINMRTENMKFVPETATIKVGQTIRLHLENNDAFLHDYTTDEAEFIVLETTGAVHTDHDDGMDMDGNTDDAHEDDDHDSDAQVSLQFLHIAAEGNDHGDLVFQATERGEYVFYCSVPGHREAGMVGTIIIEE